MIVRNGQINLKEFKRNGLEMEQFRTMLREVGIFSMFDVDDARFETNGKLTVSLKRNISESYLFVNNGSIRKKGNLATGSIKKTGIRRYRFALLRGMDPWQGILYCC